MKMKIMDIPEGGIDLEAQASSDSWFRVMVDEAFSGDYRQGDEASVSLLLLRTCDNIQLTGRAEIDLHPSCDRCLEGFKSHLSVPLSVNLSPYQKIPSEEGEEVALNSDDLNVSFYKGEEIDLAEVLRGILALEIPIRYLCTETCRGLCPRCGENLNAGSCSCAPHQGDPRFAVLKELLKKRP